MPVYANIGGTQKQLSAVYANVGGVQKQLSSLLANVGGASKTLLENNKIIVGSEAVLGAAINPGYTFISAYNPSSANTYIKYIQYYFYAAATNVKVAIFYSTGTNAFKARTSYNVGNASAGINTLHLDSTPLQISVGDYIGIYYSTGNLSGKYGSGTNYYYLSGDQISTGTASTYTAGNNQILSLCGYYELPS